MVRRVDIWVAFLGFVPILAVGLNTGGFYPETWYIGTVGFAVVAAITLLLH